MKKILLSCFIITILVFIISCSSRNESDQEPGFIPTQQQLQAFESEFDDLYKALDIQQLSVALVNARDVVWSKGYGYDDAQLHTKAYENTEYPIGTLADIFVPVIILQLAEQEKLNLNDYVTDYGIESGSNAKIKHLLSHTSEGQARTMFNYNQQVFGQLTKVIEKASGKTFRDLMIKNIIKKRKLQQTAFLDNSNSSFNVSTSLADMLIFSKAIDDTLFFKNREMMTTLFRPVYLTSGERTPCSLGWFVQFYKNLKLCWNFGQGDEYASLLIKEPVKKLTLILLSTSPALNMPFDLHKGDLFNSKIASIFVRSFFFEQDSAIRIDCNAEPEVIKEQLKHTKTLNERDFYLQELLSDIRMHEYTGNKSMTSKLIKIYDEIYPHEIPFTYKNQQPVAEITKVKNSNLITRDFSLQDQTQVRIYAVGEDAFDVQYSDPWQDDIIEFYFDMKNEKASAFNSDADDRQYRFQYNRTDITGMNFPSDGIVFKQHDISDTGYNFEVSFPWKTLGFITPENGLKIGFDIIIGDNDGDSSTEGRKAWHTTGNVAWQNTGVFGTLILKNSAGATTDSTVDAGYTSKIPVMDGHLDPIWKNIKSIPVAKDIEGNFINKNDLDATFKILWDKNNLYIFVQVIDDIKFSRPQFEHLDYGWIENVATGDTIWTMNSEKSKSIGRDKRNIYVETDLFLEPGNYKLKYITNGAHSYGHWVSDRPETSLYGIVVYQR